MLCPEHVQNFLFLVQVRGFRLKFRHICWKCSLTSYTEVIFIMTGLLLYLTSPPNTPFFFCNLRSALLCCQSCSQVPVHHRETRETPSYHCPRAGAADQKDFCSLLPLDQVLWVVYVIAKLSWEKISSETPDMTWITQGESGGLSLIRNENIKLQIRETEAGCYSKGMRRASWHVCH